MAEAPKPAPNQLEKFINTGKFTIVMRNAEGVETGSGTFTKDQVDAWLEQINQRHAEDEPRRISERNDYLVKLAASMGTTLENLVALGGY